MCKISGVLNQHQGDVITSVCAGRNSQQRKGNFAAYMLYIVQIAGGKFLQRGQKCDVLQHLRGCLKDRVYVRKSKQVML